MAAPFLALLTAAPHRLLFFVGAVNVLTAMAWWTGWLSGWSALPAPALPAAWLHALVMQYQVLPTFIFGFLLTVFPRWMDLQPATRWHYLPVALGLLSGQALTLASLICGSALLLHVGAINTLVGWVAGMAILAGWLRQDTQRTWHARSCFAALGLGLIGWLAFLATLHGANPILSVAAIKLGTFGLLLPIYATVAHRMFPFFARNVLLGYQDWRPLAWLAALWLLCLAQLGLELLNAYAWLWSIDLPLAALSAYALWRWWPMDRNVRVPRAQDAQERPRQPSPALLKVLFIGFVWLPIASLLYAVQSLWLQLTGEFILGRAPLHALAIGFFGSLLVAMVTRVTQGHSGRPLVLGRIALLAFIGMQIVALLRVFAELTGNPGPSLVAAGLGWLLLFAPWVLRSLWIYSTPRADLRPG